MDTPQPLDPEFLSFQQALAGEYSLERELGRGGMGIVYLAREVQLERLVAIKVLPTTLSMRPGYRDRFLREARTAAQLSHPNIVPIHRVGEAGGFVYFVMSFVEGETLGQRVRAHGPVTVAAAARLLREVAWALAYAHGRGVIHRDVKPDNILLEKDTGRALVTDFGIAHVRAVDTAANAAAETLAERPMGTASFASPEQIAGRDVDGRSDLYALGVVGFYALSGRLPFDAPSVPELLAKQLGEAAPLVDRVAPGVPGSLSRAIDRCMQRDPESRFAGGEALAEALEPASIQRSELPTPLRAWLTTQNPARLLLVGWAGVSGITAITQLYMYLHSRLGYGGYALHNSRVATVLTLIPLATLAAFHLRQTRRALQAGYSVADLRTALSRWVEIRREELAFESTETAKAPRMLRAFTWTSVATLATLVAVAIRSPWIGPDVGALRFLMETAAWSTGGSLLLSNALGVRLLPKKLRSTLVGGLRKAFWNSKLGAWTGALLAKGRTAPQQVLNRPTEVALGLAAGELFAALPTAYRRDLRDLPDLVTRLEARAARIREHADELTRLAADAERDFAPGQTDRARQAAAPLIEQRDRARRDLAQAIAALEGIRLDLLRLHGGVDRADTVTSLLEQARRVEGDLDALIGAQAEVDGLMRAAPEPGGSVDLVR